MYSLLHISDLHRSTSEPVDNDTLLASLLADRDRYSGETPIVPSPNAIIVSGDLIQGAKIGEPNWQKVMHDQFRTASAFLEQLTQRLLDGDRSRIIVVPGNHDVCWNTSLAAMERVADGDYPSNVREELLAPDSPYRWNWKNRSLYKIVNLAAYLSRMDGYWECVETFYDGVGLICPIDRNRGYQLFELFDGKAVVAAFDSIAGNDCFGYSGSIERGAISRCNLALRDLGKYYDLRVATWHHSIHGPPLRDDYMEIRHVHEMIGMRFQLGLHGHQHVAETGSQRLYLSDTQTMAVVGAGSLCAGSKELPRGVNRQYNVIVLDDELQSVRVHAREMVEGDQFTRKSNGQFAQGYVEVRLQQSADAMGRPVVAHDRNVRRAVSNAEAAFHEGRFGPALDLLRQLDLSETGYARKLAVDAAIRLEEWSFVANVLSKPLSPEESVLLITALFNLGNATRAQSVLDEATQIDPATRAALADRIAVIRLLGKEA